MRRCKHCRKLVVVVIFALSSGGHLIRSCAAGDEPRKPMPATLEIKTIMGNELSRTPGYFFSLVHFHLGNDIKLELGMNRGDAEFVYSHEWITSRNEILPIIDAIYEVTNVEAPSYDQTTLSMRRIQDETLLKEIGVEPDHVAIIMNSKVQFFQPGEQSERESVILKTIAADRGKPEKHVATIEAVQYKGMPIRGTVIFDSKQIKLSKGDSFTMGSFKFAVVKIVPPDEKRHLIGWIELAHENVETAPRH